MALAFGVPVYCVVYKMDTYSKFALSELSARCEEEELMFSLFVCFNPLSYAAESLNLTQNFFGGADTISQLFWLL